MKYKILFTAISIFMYTLSFGQCAQCPSGSTSITGSTNINEQNNAVDYCVNGTWTGTVSNIGPNSTLTICPSATWEMPANVTFQQNFQFDNYGTITDNGNNFKLKIQGTTSLSNKLGGIIEIGSFENQDADFVNEGSLTAENIYLHGPSSNTGTITSRADCGGNATTSCGFFIGNKNQSFNNTGSIEAIDMTLQDGVIGGNGTFDITGTLIIQNNGASTDNNFYVNNLTLAASLNITNGNFVVSGDLDCNNANITASICLEDSGQEVSSCNTSTGSIPSCSAVPVIIADFKVQQLNEKLLFVWEAASEINLSHYEVLYSTNGIDYEILLESKAIKAQFYQENYEGLADGVFYFRLKSVDFDGKVQFHKTVKIVQDQSREEYLISPNPVSRDEIINIAFRQNQNVLVSIYNLNGEKVISQYYKERNSINLDLNNITESGLYIIRLSTQNGIYSDEIFIR